MKFGDPCSVRLFGRHGTDRNIVEALPAMTHLRPGDPAPELHGTDQEGRSLRLAELAGERVVLYFYPKDDTPGCTAEACSLRDGYRELRNAGYEVIGVSPDGEAKHRKFIAKYDLPFRLLADVDLHTARAYGVWGPKKFMGRTYDGIHRTTFIIGADGRIERIIADVHTKAHAAQVMQGEGAQHNVR